ncbi:hypothetical protein ANCCEY_12211 [Ancylostoma ceylanicum]|uniref:Neurotransmitter-gated ion-channel ligand-binding domain-containing protein n=1 Tax=Ancylostoma ceylanicum TaxID=53326 RepID=A0A0D6LA72_9BILA|nr:hypothetical protein ANCCEY_12211 [Ancylostoma ceylanicum]
MQLRRHWCKIAFHDYICAEARGSSKKLTEYLLSRHNLNAPPDGLLDLHYEMELVHILGIDELKQTMTVLVYVDEKWTDPSLSWDPALFGNISKTWIPLSKIWIASWTYGKEKIRLHAHTEHSLEHYTDNEEWRLLKVSVVEDEYEHEGINVSELRYDVSVKRRPLFYMVTLTFPSYVMCAISVVGLFARFSTTGERELVGYSGTGEGDPGKATGEMRAIRKCIFKDNTY